MSLSRQQSFYAAGGQTYFIAYIVYLFYLSLLGLVLTSAFVASGYRSRCPSCGRWWARRSVGRQYLGRKTRNESRYSIDSPLGDFSYNHQGITVVYDEYENDYACRKCGHRWRTMGSRTGSPFTKSTWGFGS